MKNVFYLRHAKSSWDDLNKPDIERTLNSRGNRDAPFMASKLEELLKVKNKSIDLILSSNSIRTKETILLFRKETFVDVPVTFDPVLYHSSSDYLIDCLHQVDDSLNTVLVCAHNPGISHLAFDLNVNTDNVPTCGIIECTFMVESWLDISIDNAKKGSFIYPKMYSQ